MGFTDFEKSKLRSTLRSQSEIESLREQYLPDDVMQFLDSQGLRRQVRDYSIIPRVKKISRPESLTMTYFLDMDTNIHEILLQWQDFLSPPVS